MGNPSIRIGNRSRRNRGSTGAGCVRIRRFAAVATAAIAAAVVDTPATGVAAAVVTATIAAATVVTTAAGFAAALALPLEQPAQEATVPLLAATAAGTTAAGLAASVVTTAVVGTAATGVAAAVVTAVVATATVVATTAGFAAAIALPLEEPAQEATVLLLAATARGTTAAGLAAAVVTATVVTATIVTASTRLFTTTLRLARVASAATSQHGV